MSGHNKWSQIKHKKAVTDAQRSKLFAKYSNFITIEARKANNDRNAAGLLSAIERAKKDSMPKENIERAIRKGFGAQVDNLQEVLFETFGPGGIAVLITAVTDNNNRTSQEIKHILTRQGYQLGTPGSASWAFTKTVFGFTPTAKLTPTPADEVKLGQLLTELSEQADVQDIFTSIDEVV